MTGKKERRSACSSKFRGIVSHWSRGSEGRGWWLAGVTYCACCCCGGIKAVLWSDLMQSILMGVAIVTVTIAAVTQSGGLTAAWEKARAAGRLTVLDERTPLLQSLMSPTERHSLSNLLAGGTLIYCSLYGVNQTQVQRLLTIKSLSKARLALVIAWPVTSLLSLACCAVYVVTKLRTTVFVLSTLFAL